MYPHAAAPSHPRSFPTPAPPGVSAANWCVSPIPSGDYIWTKLYPIGFPTLPTAVAATTTTSQVSMASELTTQVITSTTYIPSPTSTDTVEAPVVTSVTSTALVQPINTADWASIWSLINDLTATSSSSLVNAFDPIVVASAIASAAAAAAETSASTSAIAPKVMYQFPVQSLLSSRVTSALLAAQVTNGDSGNTATTTATAAGTVLLYMSVTSSGDPVVPTLPMVAAAFTVDAANTGVNATAVAGKASVPCHYNNITARDLPGHFVRLPFTTLATVGVQARAQADDSSTKA